MTTPTTATETTPFPTLRPEPFCSGPCATASPERMRRALLAERMRRAANARRAERWQQARPDRRAA